MPREDCPKLGELIDYLDSLNGRADLDVLRSILARADVSREDFGPHAVFGTKGYKRNTVCKSDHYELLCLCWRSGHCTPIHDHKGSSCAFRVIEGVGTEVRFEKTGCGLVCPVKTTRMEPGYICAAQDEDIHQIANMQAPGRDLITMHIYSPPLSRINTYKYAEPADLSSLETGAAIYG
jgi:cysteine dioxygenase